MEETTIKSLYNGGERENSSETQRTVFIINAISKAYKRVKKIQNQKFQKKMLNMQACQTSNSRKEKPNQSNRIIDAMKQWKNRGQRTK